MIVLLGIGMIIGWNEKSPYKYRKNLSQMLLKTMIMVQMFISMARKTMT